MSRLLAFVIKELRELLPPMVFFAVSFNLIVLTTDLILADYRASLGNFMVATMAALVVRKSVLVANVAAVQIWIFVLFLIYTSVEELNARLGDGELMKILFTRRYSVMSRRRRQRIRSVLRLGRRTEPHTPTSLFYKS